MFTDQVKFFQKVVIFHPQQPQILTLKRSPQDRSRPNQWDLPGGNVEFGELHLPALEREILEETGLPIGPLALLEVFTRFDPTETIYTIFIGHQCRATHTAVRLSQEHTVYNWVTPAEYLALDAPTLLKRLVEKVQPDTA